MLLSLSLGCCLCGRQVIAKGKKLCNACESEFRPTPMRKWRASTGTTLNEIIEDTRLSKRTVLRADAGERVSHDAAMALARRTKLPWRTFRPKKERTP